MLETLDRAERLTVALFVGFVATLAITVVVDEPIGWLLWAIATVAVVGSVLVLVNRSSQTE